MKAVAVPTLGVLGLGAAGLAEVLQIDVRRRWSTTVELPELCFYTAQQSVRAGETLTLSIHSTSTVKLRISRLGNEPRPVVFEADFDATPQSSSYDFWQGFDWPGTEVPIGADWQSGLYLMELESPSGARYRQCVVVTPSHSAPTPSVAVVLSTNTWAAYNEFGGLSNYRDWATPFPLRYVKKLLKVMNWRVTVGNRRSIPALPLPFHRPNQAIDLDLADLDADPVDHPSHLVRAEWSVLRHFDDLGIDYGVYSDHDVAFGSGPEASPLMVFVAHSEYWSEEMKGRFIAHLDRGGKALFLSGNHWYRTVKFLERGLEVVDDRVDPVDVASVLGSGYTADGYETYAPYRIVDATHPVFAGLDLTEGDNFAGPDVQGRGGSGYETDKINSKSGKVSVLAVGENPEGPAFMVWKEHGAGGWVCNFGSVGSAPWLERCETTSRIVQNVVDIALGGVLQDHSTKFKNEQDRSIVQSRETDPQL